MVKKKNKQIIHNKIKKYIKLLIKNKINPEQVYLYGSYAKNIFSKDSDIDLAIVSSDFTGNIFDDQFKLLKLRREIDINIEPYPFLIQDFEKSNPFVNEIISTGEKIY